MAYIDVDIDDILWGMSNHEKQELIDTLYQEGFIPTKESGLKLEQDEEWDTQVGKLMGNKWRLSKEDEGNILNIVGKIPQ
jgi:phosphosulfolactate synthase (CoM biosynthesis protein A)